jgi:hypothetical protein
LTNRENEVIEINGLTDVTVGTETVALCDVLLFAGRGEDDDAKIFRARVGSQAREDFQTIHAREFEIQKDDRGLLGEITLGVSPLAKEIFKSFTAITSDNNIVENIVATKCAESQSDIIGVVFDKQNDAAVHGCLT